MEKSKNNFVNALRWFFGGLAVLAFINGVLAFDLLRILASLLLMVLLLPPLYAVYSDFVAAKTTKKLVPVVNLVLVVAFFALFRGFSTGGVAPTTTHTADTEKVRASLTSLTSLIEKLESSGEGGYDRALSDIAALAKVTDASEYVECLQDSVCHEELLGSVVMLSVEDGYGWSSNNLSARAPYIDFLSGQRQTLSIEMSVRNGSTNESKHPESSRYGLNYSVSGDNNSLSFAEAGASKFTVLGVVTESRFGNTNRTNRLTGFIISHEVDDVKLAALKRAAEPSPESNLAETESSSEVAESSDVVDTVGPGITGSSAEEADSSEPDSVIASRWMAMEAVPESMRGINLMGRYASCDIQETLRGVRSAPFLDIITSNNRYIVLGINIISPNSPYANAPAWRNGGDVVQSELKAFSKEEDGNYYLLVAERYIDKGVRGPSGFVHRGSRGYRPKIYKKVTNGWQEQGVVMDGEYLSVERIIDIQHKASSEPLRYLPQITFPLDELDSIEIKDSERAMHGENTCDLSDFSEVLDLELRHTDRSQRTGTTSLRRILSEL
ncbi:MAG: hypothetical protein LAT56_14360 [Wenzhouxiangella sp.]|nr:hypothetical protein [Wenzhouxiangella sp.]